MDKIIIFGIGSMAKVMHYFFTRDSAFEVVGFTVDKAYITGEKFCNLEVVAFENVEDRFPPAAYKMFIAIGPSKMNDLREQKFNEAKERGYTLVSYVSKFAICNSELGENCFVGDMAIVNPFVEIGMNNIFHEGTILSNDSVIGNNCYVAPKVSVSTYSKVGDNCVIGTGAVIKTNVSVAPRTLVGATCYISKDTQEEGVYGEKSSLLYGCISSKINITF